jgi:hypothetical protein
MNVVAGLTVRALRRFDGEARPHYCQALTTACRRAVPVFGTERYGDLYRAVAVNPYWMATSLMMNAQREGEGAGQLWDLSVSTPDASLAAQVRQHAIDESRHSRAYISLLDLAFPGAVDAEFHAQLTTLSPGYTQQSARHPHPDSLFARPITVDDLIQMNIAEIRTLIHQRLQRPVILAHCAPERRTKLTRILDVLLTDETRHIAYTANLIEEFARAGGAQEMRRLMQERLADFNAITLEDVGRNVFEST